MTLSILMITYNSFEILEGALKSAQDISEEILIGDSGSTDGTVELAEKYGATVMIQRGSNLGQRKQQLIDTAKGNWVLVLDADERLSHKLRDEIRFLLTKTRQKDQVDAYNIPYQNYVFEKPVHWGGERYSKMRLFRRGYGRVTQVPLHEEILVTGSVGELTGTLHHYSYRSFGQMFGKFTRYAWIAACEKARHKEPLTLKKIFLFGPHMFCARFIKDHGYRDGWRGLVLALVFSYMEQVTYFFLLIHYLFYEKQKRAIDLG